MTAYAANPVADRTYDDAVRPVFADLTGRIVDIDEPLERLAVIARLEERLKPVLDSLKTFAVRDAREAGASLSTVGDALGVTAQRAHQIANAEEATTP